MPLTMAEPGVNNFIKRVGGRPETRQFLESLGFIPGGRVSVISKIGGNLIVEVKGAQVALDKQTASKVITA